MLYKIGYAVLLVIATQGWAANTNTRREMEYPPSPPLNSQIPEALGHVPLFGSFPHETFKAWKETYGPVIGIKFGKVPAVILNDPKIIRTALEKPELGGRPQTQINKDRSDGVVEGVLFTEGQKWQEQRDFAMSHLNQYNNYAKKEYEAIAHEQIQEFGESVKAETADSPDFSTRKRFNAPVFNILWTMFTGESFKQNDPALQEIVGRISLLVREGPPEADLAQIVPELVNVVPNLPAYSDILNLLLSIVDFAKKYITEAYAKFQAQGPTKSNSFVDKYFEKISKTSDPASSFHKEQGVKSLTYSMMDMLVAGTETVSTTLEWALLYLAKYPEVQQNLQQELQDVTKGQRLPTLADRPNLPYAKAVLKEVLRFSSIVPLSVSHRSLQNTSIDGFKVDENSIIIANTYNSHFDSKVWSDPEVFRPERFLESGEGGGRPTQAMKESFMPFGAGYRECLGKKVASETLFLFITGLVQKFTIEPSTSAQELSIQPNSTQFLSPQVHTLKIKPRN